MTKDYCVYVHKTPDGAVFYVGRGKKTRSKTFSAKCRNKFWVNYVKKYCPDGKPIVEYLSENLTIEEADQIEQFWIAVLGRKIEKDRKDAILVNICSGGGGTSGRPRKPVSEETRRKQSLAKKGKISSAKGRKWSLEARQNFSKKMTGPHNFNYGKKRPPKHLDALSAGRVTCHAKLISPDNKIYYVDHRKKFCDIHNLDPSSVARLIYGKAKTHKGWSLLEKLDIENGNN